MAWAGLGWFGLLGLLGLLGLFRRKGDDGAIRKEIAESRRREEGLRNAINTIRARGGDSQFEKAFGCSYDEVVREFFHGGKEKS